jgi:SAM-dependent methyltransferase
MAAPTSPAEAAPCPLCGARGSTPLLVGYDREFGGPGDFPYGRCTGCGLLRQDPLPAPERIAGFYPAGYAPHAAGERGIRDSWINRLAIRHYYGVAHARDPRPLRPLFGLLSGAVLRDLSPPRGAHRVLDVGCGAGGLLARYRTLGWEARGVEINPSAVAAARDRGLDVAQGTIEDVAPVPGGFDLLLLNHVLEHVLDPLGVLRRARQLLAPGGRIRIVTPNAASLGLALFGSCWFPLDAPRHLCLFDARTLRALAERAELAVVRLATRGERRYGYSRRYQKLQGRVLPADPAERRAAVERARRAPRAGKGFERLMRPVEGAAALVGRGDTLVAELAATPRA